MNPENSELPTEFQREIGTKWMAKYGHLYTEDPAFVAACVYRLMRLALMDPDCREVQYVMGFSVSPKGA